MNKYIIRASYVSYVETTVEADNEDEAREIAYDLDGGDFKETALGDWNVDDIVEIK